MNTTDDLFRRLEQLNEIGAALSSERDITRLLEKILDAAKTITHADGGTLYRRSPDGASLAFEIVRTDSLGIRMGGASGTPIDFPPVPLREETGAPNNSMVAAWCALHEKSVNIADAYEAQGFDFSGTRKFDARTGYRSKSFLTVPMKNHEAEVIGVLQLINCTDAATGAVVPFSEADHRLAESLASQAAIALTNRQLIVQLEELFESFIRLINLAIDEKSHYTGGHCQRVPVLTMMLAEAVNDTTTGPLADFTMTDQDRYELKIAGLVHDCGKVTTPVHVVDKSTKLETLFDRVHQLDTRFEVLERDAEIAMLRARLALREERDAAAESQLETHFENRVRQLREERAFLHHCNVGVEAMSPEDQERVGRIGRGYRWTTEGREENFLSEEEIENLSIRAGTLTKAEREIINYHIVATIKMLEALPWPRHLANVPEYAGGHHERMDGKGYPRGLTRDQMSVQARVMGIADIFEALTAKDRPYKSGKTLTESLNILGKMKLGGHVDPDLFDVFVRRKVYLKYAETFLDPRQIDAVDEARIPGYMP
ncbi:MAG TPA: phosphohydrolase [Rhodocyclaceae bacterium]|nr:MAG: phosphohydrolase [Betaproteobacteria bacterium CG2_30_68_42]PIV74574.1 MAG: phosphohydrolase [Rhodocyclales bacterium CG17_big_fil_post_rev_8_21_14_2_50_68_7]PJA57132.1 MAG: phosphohydrolase [Rhodocyclales bacterium CG_4_9_14_3_um_filter_68_10]HCX32099.1 phosphohydrolase [Rhodocyclaceae bacterium]